MRRKPLNQGMCTATASRVCVKSPLLNACSMFPAISTAFLCFKEKEQIPSPRWVDQQRSNTRPFGSTEASRCASAKTASPHTMPGTQSGWSTEIPPVVFQPAPGACCGVPLHLGRIQHQRHPWGRQRHERGAHSFFGLSTCILLQRWGTRSHTHSLAVRGLAELSCAGHQRVQAALCIFAQD